MSHPWLNKTNARYVAILIGIALGLKLTTQIIFRPITQRWQAQSETLNTKQRQLNELEILLSEEKSLEEQYATFSRKIQAKLSGDREESQFLTEISNVAAETNVLIESMNPQPLKDIGVFKELSVEIEMECNLGNLVRFLHTMRASSVALVANRLRLQPKSDRSALLKGHLVISTIYSKE